MHSLLDLVDENLGIAVVPQHFRAQAGGPHRAPAEGHRREVYETVALLPPPQATSPAARALMTLLETGTPTA